MTTPSAALSLALLASTATLALTAAARAADIPATTSVDAVTVFPQGAEVRRVVKIRIPAGSHTLIVPDLPRQAQPASIRVEGKANGRLEIGAVDSRHLSVPRIDPQTSESARRRIETEIERLRDERAGIVAEQQAAETQRAFLTNLLQLPTRPTPTSGSAAPEDWGKVLALISKDLAPINKAILEAGTRIREVDRRIKDAEGRLRAEAPAMEERTEVKVAVAAAEPVEAEIAIRYQVASASWTPVYDARLAAGSKQTAPKITVTRRALVQQRTGEAWANVALALSTTRPSSGATAPELRPITVDFPPDRPPPAPAPIARAAPRSEAMRDMAAPAAPAKVGAANLEKKVDEAVQQQAQVEVGTFQALYTILGRQSVAPTGELRRVQIDESNLDTTLTVRAAPRVDDRAFVYAKLVVPRASPWLPGQVSLFRDGTFVGNGRLPQLAPGQDHELGFGVDDRVRVRALSVEERRAETGLISSTKTETKAFKFTIKSLHERPIQFQLQDQLPVSNHQDIKVELIARPQPTKRDLDDRRGVLAWEDKLAPDEEKTIDFGWRMSWPAAKTISYGR